MSHYVAAYDTEAVYPWWDGRQKGFSYTPGIDYVMQQGLLYYMPIFHPWSIYRIDRQAAQVAMLLKDAGAKMEITSCTPIYHHIREHPALAADEM